MISFQSTIFNNYNLLIKMEGKLSISQCKTYYIKLFLKIYVGTSSDHFKATQVTMVPYPAQPGQNVTTHAYGFQGKQITYR
jgi:hypothetical protein